MGRHTNRRSKIKAQSETVLALLLWCAAAGLWIGHPIRQLTPEPTLTTLSRTSQFNVAGIPNAPPRTAQGKSFRRIYGHSLVAGGIHSIDELMAVIEKDPRLAEHYKNFDLSKAHIITLDHNVVAYVSYRLAEGIYWQAKPSVIAKGEQVITDGMNFIRVRCGNLISYAPGFPTNPGEPKDIDIVVALRPVGPPDDVPIPPTIPNLPLPAPPLLGPVPPPPPPGGWLPPIVSPCCIGSGGPPPIPPHISADEFSTVPLKILGHSYRLPSEELAILAGLFLVIALRLTFPK
jgi:hypothetical protein